MFSNAIGMRAAWLRAVVTAASIGLSVAARAADDLLDPEDAFRLTVRQKDKQTLVAQFNTAKDYYLYKDRMRFSIKDGAGVSIQSVRFPAGQIKEDPNFGRVEVFKNKVEVDIALQRPAPGTKVTLLTDYQGCEEKRGVCYMPMQKPGTLTLR